MKISFYSFAWLLPAILFFIHIAYLNYRKNQEIFFSNFSFLEWKIYPHTNQLFQNIQFLFYSVVATTTIFINIFLIYIAPVFLLGFAIIKFSKVQDLVLDWFYFLLFCVELWFVLFYLFYANYKYESIFHLSKNSFINRLSILFLKYVPFSLMGVVFIFVTINFYFSNSILLTQNKEIQDYKLNSLILGLNPLFYETSEDYSFLFPRLNLPYQDLTTEKNIYFYKRNFCYANFMGSKLKFLSFHSANTNFANFQEVKWE